MSPKPFEFKGKRSRRLLLVGLSALAFALRVQGLSFQSLWRDEVDSIRFAGQPLAQLFHAFASPGQNGPLYFLLLRPWLVAGGESEFSLRFFSVVFGVLVIPLVYRVSLRLFPRQAWAGVVAALLAATSPYLVWYSQEGKMYAVLVGAVLLSMERMLAAMQDGGWRRWLGYVLITSLACYIHLTSALIVPAQVLVFSALRGWSNRSARQAFMLSLGVLVIPYLPLLIWQVPMLTHTVQTGYSFVPLPEMLASLMSSYSLGVVSDTTWWALAIVAVGLLAGLLLPDRLQETGSGGATVSWLLAPIFLFYLVTLRRPMFTARYLIFVLPALLLLLAVAVAKAARRSGILAAVLLAGLLAVQARGVWLQARTPLKTDFRAATRYVAQRLAPGDLIVFEIPHGRYSFEYYYPRFRPIAQTPTVASAHQVFLPWLGGGAGPYRWAEGPYTNAGMTPQELDARMDEIVDGSRVLWLVASEAALWDQRGMVQRWLETHTVLVEKAQFTRVTVYGFGSVP